MTGVRRFLIELPEATLTEKHEKRVIGELTAMANDIAEKKLINGNLSCSLQIKLGGFGFKDQMANVTTRDTGV